MGFADKLEVKITLAMPLSDAHPPGRGAGSKGILAQATIT